MTSLSSSKTVLIVGNFPSPTAAVRNVCEDLAPQLSSEGWHVLKTSYKISRISRLLDVIGAIWNKRKQFGVAQVDVFSGRGFVMAEAACQTLRCARKPFVLMLRGGNLPSFSRKRSRRVRRLLQSADAVVAPSRYLLEEMRDYRSDIRLIPNPLAISAHSFQLRKQPSPRLVWVRSFHQTYNPSLGPKVVALLASEYPDINLTMVGADKGDGSLNATRRIARDLNIAAHVFMPGRVPNAEVPRWLAKGDIFLNTTNVDNTPLSVLEAMACGLCVVSTDVGGMPYLVEDERDALLVPADDDLAMATAVRRILKHPNLAERLSLQARTSAEQHDWSAVLPQWDGLLSNIAKKERSCGRDGTQHLA